MVLEELESRFTNYLRRKFNSILLVVSSWTMLRFLPAFSELHQHRNESESSKKEKHGPRICFPITTDDTSTWSSNFVFFFFLLPRARELKGLSLFKHSPALSGVHLLFLPSILLFCGINSRLLLKGHLNKRFLFNWKYKAGLGFLNLDMNHDMNIYLSICLSIHTFVAYFSFSSTSI